MSELGHEITVFTPNSHLEKSYDIENIEKIEIVEIGTNEKIGFNALQFWLKLPKYFRKSKFQEFDIIHVNGISYSFFKKKLLEDVPHLLTLHHSVINSIESNKPSTISRFRNIGGETSIIMPLIERRCIKSVDKIIAVSEFTKKQIEKFYDLNPKNIDVVYSGMEQREFSFTKENLSNFKKNLGLDDKPIILFVGRVNDKRKGLDILLNAFNIVLKKKMLISL